MCEEEEASDFSETEDVILGQVSLNNSLSNEEIFSFATRG